MPKMTDLFDREDGYYLLEIKQPDQQGERLFEVFRTDGFNFGVTPESHVDRLVEQDKANPAPETGYTLVEVVERPAPQDPPPPPPPPPPPAPEPEPEPEPEPPGETVLYQGDGPSIIVGEVVDNNPSEDEDTPSA